MEKSYKMQQSFTPLLFPLGLLLPASGCFGLLWPALVRFGPLWPALARFGLLWPDLARFGLLWSNVFMLYLHLLGSLIIT